MPKLLEHIDAIGRRLKRDVLYIEFGRSGQLHRVDYKRSKSRRRIIEWLDSERIHWCECGPYASETCLRSYAGEIFVEVPFDETDAQYRKVQSFLEYPDGSMRFDDATFYVITLEQAMRNARHDEPGFWQRWAENF